MQEPSKPSPQAPVVGQLIDLFQDWEEVPAKPSAVAALEEARALNKLYNSDVVTNMPPSAASQVFRLPSILEPQSAPPENYGAHRQADDHPQDPRDLINFDTPKPNQFEQRSLNCHVSADLPSSDADVQSGTGPDVKTLRGPSSASMKTATEPSDKENVSPQSVSSGKEGTPECPDGEWHQPICWTEVIKDVFRQLQPALSAARSFPGFVSLEVQIGLIMVEAFPSKMWDIPLTLQKLQELLLDDTGLEEATVSTNFMNRVTTSPADVDHILNIESNGQRVFERDVAQRSTCYEFHCKTPAGEAIIVKVDDKRGMTIASPPPALLTTVQLAFPAFVWDAAVFLHGHKSPDTELDPHIERAAQFLVRELWIEPNQKKVHLLACTTSQLKVEQVIVKRTTLHRYRQGNTETPTDDDICLRITETQDLLISTNPTGENVFKAWCAPLAEMTKANRQWWEVGLISPAINKLLKTNESLQLGESTDAWCSADILGNEIDLVSGEDEAASDPVQSSRNSSSISSHPVAAGIGSSGLGGLLRLTESVVQSIDGVGGDNGTMDDGAAGTSSFESAAVSRPAISRVTRPRSFHETDGCTALVVAEEGNGELQSSQDNGRDFW